MNGFSKVFYVGEDFHMGLRYRKSYDLVVDGKYEYCIHTEDDKRLSNLPKYWFMKEEEYYNSYDVKKEVIKIRFKKNNIMEIKEFIKHLKTKKYFLESEDGNVAIIYKNGFKRCVEFNSKTRFCFIFNVDDRGKTDVRYKGLVESTEQFDLIDRLTS